MKRFTIHQSTRIYVLTSTAGGLAWRTFPIERLTARSVFVATPLGLVQLSRPALERHGRVIVAGETFSLHRWDLPTTPDPATTGKPRDGPYRDAQPLICRSVPETRNHL